MDAIKKLLFTPIGELGRGAPPVAVARRPERHFPRYRVPVPVTARAGRREVAGTTATLGMGGLFLACREAPFPTNTPVTVTLVPDRRHPGITTHGQVIYLEDGGMGIRFTGLSPDDARRIKALFRSAGARG
ncbi:MAG: PilZ domain-containing protein [Nitrospirae bacterium]|nr:PilZ domain-containing protein [Nitrospirota bacterium]